MDCRLLLASPSFCLTIFRRPPSNHERFKKHREIDCTLPYNIMYSELLISSRFCHIIVNVWAVNKQHGTIAREIIVNLSCTNNRVVLKASVPSREARIIVISLDWRDIIDMYVSRRNRVAEMSVPPKRYFQIALNRAGRSIMSPSAPSPPCWVTQSFLKRSCTFSRIMHCREIIDRSSKVAAKPEIRVHILI